MSEDVDRFFDRRNRLILRKKYLCKIYMEWSKIILGEVRDDGITIEVGATNPVTRVAFSEIKALSIDLEFRDQLDVRCDAQCLPLIGNSISNIVAIDSFHHFHNSELFLAEANRVLAPGGRLIMIEPWNNKWAKFIYKYLHPEPFLPDADWTTSGSFDLAGGNGALPWIVFQRDQHIFMRLFPEFQIIKVNPIMPISYVLSGGARSHIGSPGFLYGFIRKFERMLEHCNVGLSALIVIEKAS